MPYAEEMMFQYLLSHGLVVIKSGVDGKMGRPKSRIGFKPG